MTQSWFLPQCNTSEYFSFSTVDCIHCIFSQFFLGAFCYCNMPDVIQLCIITCLGSQHLWTGLISPVRVMCVKIITGIIINPHTSNPTSRVACPNHIRLFIFSPCMYISTSCLHFFFFYFFLTGIQMCQSCLNKVLVVLNTSLQRVGLSSKQAGIACLLSMPGCIRWVSVLQLWIIFLTGSERLSLKVHYFYYIASIADLRQDSALIVDYTDTTNYCE